MTDDRAGDDFLRDHGILLPCAETFGWSGLMGPSSLAKCDRPYGHTGPHMAEGFWLTGGQVGEACQHPEGGTELPDWPDDLRHFICPTCSASWTEPR